MKIEDPESTADFVISGPFTMAEERAIVRVRGFVDRRGFTTRPHPRRFFAELLMAGVIAASAVALIVTVMRHSSHPATPPGRTSQISPPGASATPTALASARSTITATPPLIVYLTKVETDGSDELTARNYAGQLTGTLLLPPDLQLERGYEVAPDGSKVLADTQVFDVHGVKLGQISWTDATLPVWADDSNHLCGVTYRVVAGQATGSLIEFDTTGRSRHVTDLPPEPAAQSGWQLLACSPTSDRALVVADNGSMEDIVTVRLSSGAPLSSHPLSSPSWAASPVATHDGRLVAVNEASSVAIRNVSSWALQARIVRWGSQAGYPLIGRGVAFSWDGTRLLIDGGGASGATHPVWIVDWALNTDLVTNSGAHAVALGNEVVPLTEGSSFFIGGGSADQQQYLLQDDGRLLRVSGY